MRDFIWITIRLKWSILWTFLICTIPSRSALCQITANHDKTAFEIWMPALAALLGGIISGAVAPLLKDVVIQRWNENHSDNRLKKQIEESYFAPLSASAEKLIWRMSEIIIDKRSHFLMLKTPPKDYNEYKRLSTLYRISSLMGWMRAISLELSALPRGGFGVTSSVFNALASVRSALADGHGVEERRFLAFCKHCDVRLTDLNEKDLGLLASDFEVTLYAIAGDEFKTDHRHILNSSRLHQEFICRSLLQFLAGKQIPSQIDDDGLYSSIDDIVKDLGYRESLIYREWQDSIGDSMIITDEQSASRRYRIIGFEEFEELILNGQKNWITPMREFIEDVNFISPDPADERPRHLIDLAQSVASLLIAISEVSSGALVNPDAHSRAKQILQLSPQLKRN